MRMRPALDAGGCFDDADPGGAEVVEALGEVEEVSVWHVLRDEDGRGIAGEAREDRLQDGGGRRWSFRSRSGVARAGEGLAGGAG
jgi:hypothetical protein